MPVTVIVGGQYGSEGKGKVAALEAMRTVEPIMVRCGGPNSGHTSFVHGRDIILRQLPSGATKPGAVLAIAAGAVVDEDVLIQEAQFCGVQPERLFVDPRAVLIEDKDRLSEEELALSISSTASGNGQALVRRILRNSSVRLIEHSDRIRAIATVKTVAPLLQDAVEKQASIIIEGTQGFGLSLLHGSGYPYLTSKDTTASNFIMEAGLSPRDVNHIMLVVRTFPIRVGGPSGELKNEITWDQVRQISNAPSVEPEFTSVTRRLRRVALFDIDQVMQACRFNKPTALAVMGLDRLDYSARGVTKLDKLSDSVKQFLQQLLVQTQTPITWCGTGFSTLDAFNFSDS